MEGPSASAHKVTGWAHPSTMLTACRPEGNLSPGLGGQGFPFSPAALLVPYPPPGGLGCGSPSMHILKWPPQPL